MLNSDAACSLFSNTKDVLRWIGTARAPVAGSGAAPACSARVSKPGSDGPGMAVCGVSVRGIVCYVFRHAGHQTHEESLMKVSDILRVKGSTLYTIPPEQPLAQALNTMAEFDIGSLVVMEHGDLTGMLTFREVIKAVVKNGGTVGTLGVRAVMD